MKNKDLTNKLGMISFIVIIITFVFGSSFIYFNNTSNVEIKIKTDNEVNKEKSAINEALTKTLVLKNDTISIYRKEIIKKDSILLIKTKQFEKDMKKIKQQKDSLSNILKNFKQSDLQPIGNKNIN